MAAIDLLLSSATVNHYGLNRAFELARQLGLDGIELYVDERADTRQLDYIRRLMEDCFIRVPVVHAPRPGARYPAADGTWDLRLQFARDLAAALGAGLVVTHPPQYDEAAGDPAGLQFAAGVPVAIELMSRQTRSFCGFTFTRRRWRRGLPRDWSALPAVVFDTTHVGSWSPDLVTAWREQAPRVKHIHLSNLDGRAWHLPPQLGRLPLREFLAAVVDTRYRGTISLELAPHTIGGYELTRVAATLAESVTFVRTALVQAFAARQRSRAESGGGR
ncbi:MAG TPA: TIM barrel protein [bacterium]|nr:TIM barrel protein [bacterium]